MAASTIPAAKAALRTAILVRLPTMRLAWGRSPELPADTEWISVDDAREVRRDWIAFTEYQESYLLQVHVNTIAAGGTNETAELRLWVIVAEIEAAVVANTTLSGTVDDARPNSVVPSTGPYDSGWWAEADVVIACRAFGKP